jgi:hypothetical protein
VTSSRSGNKRVAEALGQIVEAGSVPRGSSYQVAALKGSDRPPDRNRATNP